LALETIVSHSFWFPTCSTDIASRRMRQRRGPGKCKSP